MRLAPPSSAAESPGQFWKDFIRDTAPVFCRPTIEQLAEFVEPTFRAADLIERLALTGKAA